MLRQRANVMHGGELPAPLFRVVKSHAASEVGVSHTCYQSTAIGQARGVPPTILESFNQSAGIDVATLKESGDADEAVDLDNTSGAARGQSRAAASRIHDEACGY